MELWKFLEYICTVLIGSGIVAWVVKKLISYWIDKGVEKYKHDLQLNSEEYKGNIQIDIENYKSGLSLETEKYRAELARITNEHSIKFSKLHEKRAEIIKETHEKIHSLYSDLHDLLSPYQKVKGPSLSDKEKKVCETFNDASDYYQTNKLYFEKATCNLIDSLFHAIKVMMSEIQSYPMNYDDPAYSDDNELFKEKAAMMQRHWNNLDKIIKAVVENLEDKFRTLLGVS